MSNKVTTSFPLKAIVEPADTFVGNGNQSTVLFSAESVAAYIKSTLTAVDNDAVIHDGMPAVLFKEGDCTLDLACANAVVCVKPINNTGSKVYIPTNAQCPFRVGTQIAVLHNSGTFNGTFVTIKPTLTNGNDVNLLTSPVTAREKQIFGVGCGAILIKIATNTWFIGGDLK